MNKILLFLLYSSFALAQNDLALAEKFQLELNKSYADSLKSPLTKEDFKHFKGLDFFSINEKYIVQATFIRTKKEKPFGMKTTTSRTPLYVKYGELHFSIEGKDFKLNVYQNKDLIKKPGYADYLFLPFSDLTCGKESYIGGRYVDMRIQKGKIWTIDFNKAYNPYCAYNYEYSCPIVPLENDLDIEILAGVKKFHD
ncbi:DUF1684 domain-containing protein [Flavobacterium sp.]|uniref:DUF1684 domain-containing protein n=1 Tax=Flavobacterium sp. TaxID=239 RepID=UPI0040487A3E